jgi:hypothetical protein
MKILLYINNINNSSRPQVSLSYCKSYTIAKRFLLSRASLMPKGVSLVPKRLFQDPLTKSRVTEVIRIKQKSGAAKDLAIDETGKHPHTVEKICESKECEVKKCSILCESLKETKATGFLTHGPVAGKFSCFVADIDANGKPGCQYHTKNHDKSKKIDAQKTQQYENSKEIKHDTKVTAYLKKYENKFDN